LIEAAAIGVAAGLVSGMLGVGGGILFVPGLVLFAGLHQVDAEATSLLAIIPTALVGAWRQYRYGNVRVHDATVLGVVSAAGAVAGVALANLLPTRVLEVAFGILLLMVAMQLVHRASRPRRPRSGGDPDPPRNAATTR
jgi:uncharacterized membrane protein YfcA